MDDQQAIERYRYMLRTAPPDEIERAHAEAFGRLTPEQRRMVLAELSSEVPPGEVGGDDPSSLARMATRAEMREPGTMERTFSRVGGPGLGGMFLSTLAGAFVGTAIAQAFFDQSPDAGAADAGAADAGAPDSAESADYGAAGNGDFGDMGADAGVGGDFGDFGGGFGDL
jgi:hypothetical protein